MLLSETTELTKQKHGLDKGLENVLLQYSLDTLDLDSNFLT